MGLLLSNGSYLWSKAYSFRSSPSPGQNSLQRVIIFGDLGKVMNFFLFYEFDMHKKTFVIIVDIRASLCVPRLIPWGGALKLTVSGKPLVALRGFKLMIIEVNSKALN